MRMRQSLAQFEADFREEAADSVVRRDKLRRMSAHRAKVRRVERVNQAGKLRFTLLWLTILATSVIVTWVMFQVLAYIAG
jgi:membrane glycosyltransferase